jgi:hypothetical protein
MAFTFRDHAYRRLREQGRLQKNLLMKISGDLCVTHQNQEKIGPAEKTPSGEAGGRILLSCNPDLFEGSLPSRARTASRRLRRSLRNGRAREICKLRGMVVSSFGRCDVDVVTPSLRHFASLLQRSLRGFPAMQDVAVLAIRRYGESHFLFFCSSS